MTLEQFKTLLDSTGLPVAYQFHKEPPDMPFITYSQPTTNNFSADSKVFLEVKHLYVTVWNNKRDEATEKTIKDMFEANDIPWSRTESYLDDEQCYEVVYEVEV